MTDTTTSADTDADATAPAAASPAPSGASRWRWASPRNIGAIYVWIAIILLFIAIEPDRFPTSQTLQSIVNQYSITGLIALSLVVPLAAGAYDLSIGYTVGFAGILVSWLLQNTGLSPVEAGALTLLACACIGLVNAFVVVGLQVDSFVGTLGVGAILASLTIAISGEQTITGRVGDSFSNLATHQIAGVSMPVIYLVVAMILLGWWLERTKMGRFIYAVGFDRESARLTGIRVKRLTTIAFVTSATLSGFAGIVLAARIQAGSPDAGPSYLIPAFSAAFLGATQLRGGRFNPWGTVIAVMLLGTGNVGLLLSGGPQWTPQLFEGVVLIAAVALTGMTRPALGGRLRAMLRRRSAAEG
jgi:ribose transport system permease protein